MSGPSFVEDEQFLLYPETRIMGVPSYIMAPYWSGCAVVAVLLAYLAVPNEQAWPVLYPNVIMVYATGEHSEVVPITHTNTTLGPVLTDFLPGLYQHVPFFYHDRFEKSDVFKRENADYDEDGTGGGPMKHIRVWECALFCGPPKLDDPADPNLRSKLFLVHVGPIEGQQGKQKIQHQWYFTEMKERDEGTPVFYARTKGRKNLEIGAPIVEPDKARSKPKLLPIKMTTIWALLMPTTPGPILLWACAISSLVFMLYSLCKDEDDY